ncbi:alpha-E domain-containing protein [Jatrophihabitans fulvus]
MLSRIAESLYWIGRYVERAEDTSRIVDVHLSRLLDDPWAPEEAVCASLLSAMGHDPDPSAVVRREEVLQTLVYDRSTPASVLGSIGAARENARRSREIVSSELWETLNVTWHEANKPARRTYPFPFLAWVRERSAMFNGVADGTLARDEAFHFMLLGRSIERADMIARMAAARSLAGDAGPSWVTLLQSCGAYQAFLRSARGAVDERRSAEFLLLDPLFPRSLMSALVVAEKSLDRLAAWHGGLERTGKSGSAVKAHRVLGMIRSELEFASPTELLDDVYQLMERVQSACSVAGDAVAQRYFPRAVVTSWMAS